MFAQYCYGLRWNGISIILSHFLEILHTKFPPLVLQYQLSFSDIIECITNASWICFCPNIILIFGSWPRSRSHRENALNACVCSNNKPVADYLFQRGKRTHILVDNTIFLSYQGIYVVMNDTDNIYQEIPELFC